MEKNLTLKPDITTSQDLSLAALSYTTSISRKFRLLEVTLRASVPITETITLTKDSKQGSNYDVVLRTVSLSSGQNFVYRPEVSEAFQSGDELKVQCTSAGGVGTVYVVIKVSEHD